MADGNASNPVGRPSKFNENTVEKILNIFKIGGTVEDACSYALIDRQTYYNWLKENQSFSAEIESAKIYADIAAKNVVVDKIVKDKDEVSARWWLERRRPKEFQQGKLDEATQITNNLLIIGDDQLSKLLYGFTKKLTESPAPVIEGEQK